MVKAGDFVLIHFAQDARTDIGKVVFKHDMESYEEGGPQLVRPATQEDMQVIDRLRQEERDAFQFFSERVAALGLPMQPVAVFLSFDGNFGDFVFTAADRVDFRALVRELTAKFKRRIFLEQVSPRERAAIADGCGSCGRTLCCSTFLKDRPPVVMHAVRSQNLLFRDREKLTGLCGKLKCCLNYELDTYEELAQDFPSMHTEVTVIATGEKVTVIGRSILDQQVRVAPAQGPVVTLRLEEVSFVARKKRGSAVKETLSTS